MCKPDIRLGLGGISLVVQRLKLCATNAGSPGSIPGKGIKPHMQLKITHATTKIEDLTAATKTQHSQINKYFLKKKE